MNTLTKRKKGEPSKKMKRATNKLAVKTKLYENGVKADLRHGGRGFTKPGSMQMS